MSSDGSDKLRSRGEELRRCLGLKWPVLSSLGKFRLSGFEYGLLVFSFPEDSTAVYFSAKQIPTSWQITKKMPQYG